FKKKLDNEEFAEYAKVHGNYYGTLKSELESARDGKDIILDIEWQGARNIAGQFHRDKVLKIFILPPSMKELEKRLKNRGTDSDETIKKRLKDAKEQISHYNEYDFIIINDSLESVFEQVKSIIITKKLQRAPQNILDDFVKNINLEFEEINRR
ncbi:MAG: guanylate kinase, partial [Rickettsiales bacterium]|nr:guanylate kinase [Rickettsiales bacterium]